MVLVTGGTGFLGAYIVKELVQQGYTVRAMRRNGTLPFFIDPSILARVEWVAGNVLDVTAVDEALEGVDTIVHAAAMVSFVPADRVQMFRVNIEGTANMVNMALEKNIRRFIHISSVAALGRTANGEVVNEEKKWGKSKRNTAYAISKYHAEMEVWRGMGEGLNMAILNPSTILGYGNWENSSCAIFKNAYGGFPWYTNGVNGFVDVEDVARAAVLLMKSDIRSERFIVNSDNWSFRNLLSTMAMYFGKKPPYREATPLLGGLAWRMEKLRSSLAGKKPLLTRESAKVAQSKTLFDNSKILQALPGLSFLPLEESIKKACDKYKAGLETRRL